MTKRNESPASEVNRAFHRVLHVLLRRRQEYVDDRLHGLSFAELHVVIAACDRADLILKDLREELEVPQSTLSSMIGRLERKGYVKRAISPQDMRSYALQATAKGRRMVEEHRKMDQQQARQLAMALDEGECAELIRLLDKVADSMVPDGEASGGGG